MRTLRLLLLVLLALIAIAMTTVPAVRQHIQHVAPAVQHVSTDGSHPHAADVHHVAPAHVENDGHHVQPHAPTLDNQPAAHDGAADHEHVALKDMHDYAIRNLGGTVVEHPETFGTAHDWDHNWELRWIDYSVDDGHVVRVYHATYKHDDTLRSINSVEMHVGPHGQWQTVR